MTWEYKVVKIKREQRTENMLNHYGHLGWELVQMCMVAVPTTEYKYFAYFKRPRQET